MERKSVIETIRRVVSFMKDPRMEGRCRHSLTDIRLIASYSNRYFTEYRSVLSPKKRKIRSFLYSSIPSPAVNPATKPCVPHLPYSSGRITPRCNPGRHSAPVRAIHSTASTNSRLSPL
jgi:hypothetical protein